MVGIYDGTEYWLDKYDAGEGWTLVHQATVNAGETHWDIQVINNEPVKTGTYELRAVVNSQQGDDIPTVVVDVVDHNPGIVEGDNSSGEHVRQEKVYREVTLHEGALDDLETVISLIIADEGRFLDTVPEDLESIGEFCEINLSNDQHELANGKKVRIRISYEDADGDGIVDGTNVSTSDLSIYYYNEENGDWMVMKTFQRSSTSCWVETEVDHLSTFGLLGSPAAPVEIDPIDSDPVSPIRVVNVNSGGSSGGDGCFISTTR